MCVRLSWYARCDILLNKQEQILAYFFSKTSKGAVALEPLSPIASIV